MKAQLTCALFLALACFLPAPAAAEKMIAPPSFTEAVEVNVVNVDVRVTDSNGRPITGLRKRDFELFEDGKRVDVSNFAAVEGGVSKAEEGEDEAPPAAKDGDKTPAVSSEDIWNLILYVDNFNLHPGNRTRTLRQLRDFLGRELTPRDRVMVVSYEQGFVVRLPFASNPAAVDAALADMEKLGTGGTSIDLQRQQAFRQIMAIQEASVADFTNPRPCPLDIARPAHEFAQLRRDEVMRTLGALTVLANSLSGVPGRKAVLYVSDGIPATPGEEVFQFLAELCGGGGASGLGRNTPGNTQETEVLKDEEPAEEGPRTGRPQPRQPSLDPLAVYDASALGPWAYKASSQAPIDAQSYSLVKQLGALVAHSNSQRVTLYTLQASGAEAPAASEVSAGPTDRLFQFASIGSAQRASLQNSLHALADGTGGRAMLDVNDFKPELARMREDFESYYSLGFTPDHKAAGAEHKLEVRVKRRGAHLRYSESYRDKTPIERAVDRTLAALLYDIQDNPLKIEVELGDQAPGPSGTVALPVRLRIPLAKVAVLRGDGVYEGNLRVLVATRTMDGRASAVKQVPVPIRIPKDDVLHALGQFYVYTLTLNLVPGEQKVAVGVRDDTSATTSYLSRAVQVIPLDNAAAVNHP